MRYELLAPHILVLGGVSQQVERGTIVDSAEVSNFSPTPLMRALDQPAYEQLRQVCDQIRAVQHWAGRRPTPTSLDLVTPDAGLAASSHRRLRHPTPRHHGFRKD